MSLKEKPITENIKLKTGHYKNTNDGCDYFISFEFGSYQMRVVHTDKVAEVQPKEVKFKVSEYEILKNMLFGGLYLIREINAEAINNTEKTYKEYSTRKKSTKGIPVDVKNQTSLF